MGFEPPTPWRCPPQSPFFFLFSVVELRISLLHVKEGIMGIFIFTIQGFQVGFYLHPCP